MNFRDRMRNSMQGRYGNDQLNRFLLIVSMVLLVIDMFIRSAFASSILSLVVAAILVWCLFRSFSRNVSARYAENEKFLGFGRRVKALFTGGARAAKDPTHAYFRCPNCHQMVRVPKGKGHIQITCPKCHTQFIRET